MFIGREVGTEIRSSGLSRRSLRNSCCETSRHGGLSSPWGEYLDRTFVEEAQFARPTALRTSRIARQICYQIYSYLDKVCLYIYFSIFM